MGELWTRLIDNFMALSVMGRTVFVLVSVLLIRKIVR